MTPERERIEEIREVFEATPESERNPEDVAIGELLDEVDRLQALTDEDRRLWYEHRDDLQSALYNHGECENELGLLREKHDALLATAERHAATHALDGSDCDESAEAIDAIAACEEKPCRKVRSTSVK